MEETSETATLDILTFWVGPFRLGVEAGQIVRLPRSSQRGLVSQASEGVNDLPVLDLRSTCGLPPASSDTKRQLLVVNRSGERLAYVVDQLGDLITVEMARHIWPLPPLLDAQKRWRQLWGICLWADEPVLLVDLEYEPERGA